MKRIIITLEDFNANTQAENSKKEDIKSGDMVRVKISEESEKPTPYIGKVTSISGDMLKVEIDSPDTEADKSKFNTSSFELKKGETVDIDFAKIEKII